MTKEGATIGKGRLGKMDHFVPEPELYLKMILVILLAFCYSVICIL